MAENKELPQQKNLKLPLLPKINLEILHHISQKGFVKFPGALATVVLVHKRINANVQRHLYGVKLTGKSTIGFKFLAFESTLSERRVKPESPPPPSRYDSNSL